MFSSLNSAVITGGTFTQYNTSTSQLHDSYERLKEATAPNAFHNSGERRDPPKCHQNTRVAILQKIHSWIAGEDPDTTQKPIMWVNGPAGAGKSAIAQSISDICYDDQLLLASFFFSRFDSSRNHHMSLIPTIAYQIAECFSGETRKRIMDHIDRDPLIFTRSLQTQITSLIVRPLEHLIDSGYFTQKCRRVVVIDGLDECNDREGQLEILGAIQTALLKHNTPLIFFIASRPEHDLIGAFRSEPLSGITAMLPLDDDYQSHQDIELFLRDNFVDLKANHPFRSRIPPLWPSEDIIRQLVLKSSGQFIYAAMVIKYIKSTRHRPPERLDVVLGLRPSNRDMPFGELDALYTQIFLSLEDPEPVLQILAFSILTASHYVPYIEEILDINPGDMDVILCDLGSVLQFIMHDPANPTSQVLHIFHASLEDFLFDKSRSGRFWIDAPSRHTEIAHIFIQNPKKLEGYGGSGAEVWPYPLRRLGMHVAMGSPTPSLKDDILSFSESKLSIKARTLKPHLQAHYNTDDRQDFLDAVKKSNFEDTEELERYLRVELGLLMEVGTAHS